MALTLIKMSGVFLELLSGGKIKASTWEDYQKYYNSLVIGIFTKMNGNYHGVGNSGSMIEDETKEIKKNYESVRKQYEK